MDSDKFVHVKRDSGGKGKKGNNKGGRQNGGFYSEGHHNKAQREGDFSFDTIHGLKLKEVEYKVPSKAERVAKRNEFNGERDELGNVVVEGVRSKFLKMLAKDHEKELVERLGLTERDIRGMREGYTPNGFNVHHKLALHGGGKNEFKNFILTPLYPHDQWHHDILDPQIENCMGTGQKKEVMLPWTDDMIYDPKKFGITKDNVKVTPNYTSRVNPDSYPKIYTPEQVADAANRKRELAKFAPKQSNGQKNFIAALVSQKQR